MTIETDAEGNTVNRVGLVTEVVTPGPALQTRLAAESALITAQIDRLAANRAQLNASAIKFRRLARGFDPMPSTVAGRDALLKEQCEAIARIVFAEKFGD